MRIKTSGSISAVYFSMEFKMFIEIKGVQFVNKGAELMLESILAQLKEQHPTAKIVMQPGKFSSYENRARIGAFQRLQLRKNRLDFNGLTYLLPKAIRNILLKFGIVTEADIDLILDASGFSYGDQWVYLLHYHAAKEAKRMKAKGKKVIFLPQAFGPFDDVKKAEKMKSAIDHSALTFARDDVSYQALASLTQGEQLHLSPDFTNLLPADMLSSDAQFASSVCLVPNSKMLSKKNRNTDWHQRYLNFWLDCIQVIQAQGNQVFLLNHEGDEDQALCEEIAALAEGDITILQESSPTRVKAIIGASKYTVCSRFHGCVSGLSQGKVVFGTSWAHKYEQLYKDYNAEALLLTPSDTKEDITLKLNQLVSSETEAGLKQCSMQLKEKSAEMWKKVHKEIGSIKK